MGTTMEEVYETCEFWGLGESQWFTLDSEPSTEEVAELERKLNLVAGDKSYAVKKSDKTSLYVSRLFHH